MREKLETALGCSFMVEKCTVLMCQSSDKWKAVSEAAVLIMTKLGHLQQIRRPSVRTVDET